MTYSKSCHDFMYVVAAVPIAANANPMTSTAGRASSAHHEVMSPMASITSRKTVE